MQYLDVSLDIISTKSDARCIMYGTEVSSCLTHTTRNTAINMFCFSIMYGTARCMRLQFQTINIQMALADLIFIAVNALKPNEQDHLEKYFLKINM